MLSPGQHIGEYDVIGPIGAGGMATVYKVRHTVLGSIFALKVLHDSLVVLPEARERFLAEGRIQARILHPNIIRVTGVLAEDGVAGLVMEYLDGPTLGEHIQMAPLSGVELVQIMGALLEGVRTIHSASIIHRDLKPENIKLQRNPDGSWRPVLFDFGVARLGPEAEVLLGHTRRLRTQDGKRMGTPGYMSPEQIKCIPDIDARTDVFALGCILYEAVSGMPAFSNGTPRAIMERIVAGDPADFQALVPFTNAALVAVCRKAMQPDRANRYADAAELQDAFQAALAQPAVPPAPPQKRRRRSVDLAVAATLALLVTAGISAAPLLLRLQQGRADQAAGLALLSMKSARTDKALDASPEHLRAAAAQADDAVAIRRTHKTLGVQALATVWVQGWDELPPAATVQENLADIDPLTADAAEAGGGEGLLARALVAATACARLEHGAPQRAALCAEASERFSAAAAAMASNPHPWLRFEVWWTAAEHHNRIAQSWWQVQDPTAARAAWDQTAAICQSARPDMSASPLHDARLARACMAAAAAQGRYGAYFRWAHWLRAHDDAQGGLASENVAQIYRSAHPSCQNLQARAATPWQPQPRTRRELFCQHAGLLALGCLPQAAAARARHRRSGEDPLMQAISDAQQADSRRCYLD